MPEVTYKKHHDKIQIYLHFQDFWIFLRFSTPEMLRCFWRLKDQSCSTSLVTWHMSDAGDPEEPKTNPITSFCYHHVYDHIWRWTVDVWDERMFRSRWMLGEPVFQHLYETCLWNADSRTSLHIITFNDETRCWAHKCSKEWKRQGQQSGNTVYTDDCDNSYSVWL